MLYERGAVRIRYEEAGSGFPLLIIPGGGLNSTIAGLKAAHRRSTRSTSSRASTAASPRTCATPTAASPPARSKSTGRGMPIPTTTSALMDHLGIDKFMVLGFCIGGPLIWNLLKRAPDRIVAAVLAQPSGSRPEMRDPLLRQQHEGLGAGAGQAPARLTMEMVDQFLTKMYRTNADFVFTVTRDFVRSCKTPVLILPDDIPAHPYAVAMEARCSRRTPR